MRDELLSAFADGLPAGPTDRSDLPGEVGRLLALVGGRTCGDVHFLAASAVEKVCARLVNNPCWNPAWWPLATTATELYAYDPIGSFRGRPGRVISFELEYGGECTLIPTLSLWLGAMIEVRDRGSDVAALARDWLRVRGQLYVSVPTTLDDDRFGSPIAVVHQVDEQRERVDFTLFILHAISFGRDPADALREIASVLDAALPYCDLAQLATAPRDDAATLARTVLVPHLTKHAKNVERLVFDFDSMAKPSFGVWAGASAAEPVRSAPTALGFDCGQSLHDLIKAAATGYTTEAWTFIRASAAFTIRELLDGAAPQLPWEHELDIYLGPVLLGRCDRDGFVPTPIPIAREELRRQRERMTAGLVNMGFPDTSPLTSDHPIPATPKVREIRHPDGRQWELSIVGEKFRATLTDGTETETFQRAVKTGWEMEVFVAAQLRAGFKAS